ncbi:MAG: 50S ribosomal protein L10 [Deltaproteobacteria bacterium]|nr:50S ribosomal protein L10 [Deltaproteobacteria bacterium]
MEKEKTSKGRLERSKVVESIKAMFESCQGGVLTDFRGLNVKQITELRRKCREQKIAYRVVKNTLTRLAVKGTAYEGLSELLVGPTGIAFSSEDAIAAARMAFEFARDNEALRVKGGFMEGSVLSGTQIDEVSKLGGRKDVLARLLSAFNGPPQKLLGVLNAVPQKFLGVLEARAKKLEEA